MERHCSPGSGCMGSDETGCGSMGSDEMGDMVTASSFCLLLHRLLVGDGLRHRGGILPQLQVASWREMDSLADRKGGFGAISVGSGEPGVPGRMSSDRASSVLLSLLHNP